MDAEKTPPETDGNAPGVSQADDLVPAIGTGHSARSRGMTTMDAPVPSCPHIGHLEPVDGCPFLVAAPVVRCRQCGAEWSRAEATSMAAAQQDQAIAAVIADLSRQREERQTAPADPGFPHLAAIAAGALRRQGASADEIAHKTGIHLDDATTRVRIGRRRRTNPSI